MPLSWYPFSKVAEFRVKGVYYFKVYFVRGIET
jgi:hypothetical protein